MADECRKRFVALAAGLVAQFVKIFVPAGGIPRMFNSVTAVVGVEIRLSGYGRALLPRHCSVPHCAERRRDSDPDSCRLSLLISWQVPS